MITTGIALIALAVGFFGGYLTGEAINAAVYKTDGTDPLYADHLKVFAVREYLRAVEDKPELVGYGFATSVINRLRDEIGDAEYKEF